MAKLSPPTFVRSLTDKARQGAFGSAIGRAKEQADLQRMITQSPPIHPLLLGPPGVGKTQLVESLSLSLLAVSSPIEIFEFDMTAFLSGTKYMGEIEEKLNLFLTFASETPDRVTFIDEFHALIGAGSHSQRQTGIEENLKPSLTNGSIKIIAATTKAEFEKFVAGNPPLARRFQVLDLQSLNDESTFAILKQKNRRDALTGQPVFSDRVLRLIVDAAAGRHPNVGSPARALKLLSELQFGFAPGEHAGSSLKQSPMQALRAAQKALSSSSDAKSLSEQLQKLYVAAPARGVADGEAETALDDLIEGRAS